MPSPHAPDMPAPYGGQERRTNDTRIVRLDYRMDGVEQALERLEEGIVRLTDSVTKMVELQVNHLNLRDRVERMDAEFKAYRAECSADRASYKADKQGAGWVLKVGGAILVACQVLFGGLLASQMSEIRQAVRQLPLLEQRLSSAETSIERARR